MPAAKHVSGAQYEQLAAEVAAEESGAAMPVGRASAAATPMENLRGRVDTNFVTSNSEYGGLAPRHRSVWGGPSTTEQWNGTWHLPCMTAASFLAKT